MVAFEKLTRRYITLLILVVVKYFLKQGGARNSFKTVSNCGSS